MFKHVQQFAGPTAHGVLDPVDCFFYNIFTIIKDCGAARGHRSPTKCLLTSSLPPTHLLPVSYLSPTCLRVNGRKVIWGSFGVLRASFGLLWAPLELPWAPVWLPSAPLGFPLAPLGLPSTSLGSLLASLGLLLAPFGPTLKL